jgi:hypothetical protein
MGFTGRDAKRRPLSAFHVQPIECGSDLTIRRQRHVKYRVHQKVAVPSLCDQAKAPLLVDTRRKRSLQAVVIRPRDTILRTRCETNSAHTLIITVSDPAAIRLLMKQHVDGARDLYDLIGAVCRTQDPDLEKPARRSQRFMSLHGAFIHRAGRSHYRVNQRLGKARTRWARASCQGR